MAELLRHILSTLGIEASDDGLLLIASIASLAVGIIFTRVLARRQQRRQANAAEAKFNAQREVDLAAFDDQLDQLRHAFSSLSQEALRNNNESFLTLAKESFGQLHLSASNELKSREHSFATLLQPIKQSMQQTDQQLRKLDQDRRVTETKLGEQISNLLSSQHMLQSETRNLVSALRRPEVRGQWGELTLKRLVELAGMSAYCDFDEQISIKTEDGLLRPDMLVHLPSKRLLVVDVKTPLDAYISATEASDLDAQADFLTQHCKNVKQRIKELGLKQYWQQFEQSPDFVILFIPGDQFLSAALDQDKGLLEYALQQRILLATPTSLVGLLRAVAYGWNQDALSKNSHEIRQVGETLYNRLQTLTRHLNKLGQHLDQSMEQFNRLAGSYSSNTLPAARKLSELGISSDDQVDLSPTKSSASRKLTE